MGPVRARTLARRFNSSIYQKTPEIPEFFGICPSASEKRFRSSVIIWSYFRSLGVHAFFHTFSSFQQEPLDYPSPITPENTFFKARTARCTSISPVRTTSSDRTSVGIVSTSVTSAGKIVRSRVVSQFVSDLRWAEGKDVIRFSEWID